MRKKTPKVNFRGDLMVAQRHARRRRGVWGDAYIPAMNFAKDLMKENGYFISKIFMGGTFNEIVAEGKKYFKEVKVFKPKSSRKDSKESFIICRKIR